MASYIDILMRPSGDLLMDISETKEDSIERSPDGHHACTCHFYDMQCPYHTYTYTLTVEPDLQIRLLTFRRYMTKPQFVPYHIDKSVNSNWF